MKEYEYFDLNRFANGSIQTSMMTFDPDTPGETWLRQIELNEGLWRDLVYLKQELARIDDPGVFSREQKLPLFLPGIFNMFFPQDDGSIQPEILYPFFFINQPPVYVGKNEQEATALEQLLNGPLEMKFSRIFREPWKRNPHTPVVLSSWGGAEKTSLTDWSLVRYARNFFFFENDANYREAVFPEICKAVRCVEHGARCHIEIMRIPKGNLIEYLQMVLREDWSFRWDGVEEIPECFLLFLGERFRKEVSTKFTILNCGREKNAAAD